MSAADPVRIAEPPSVLSLEQLITLITAHRRRPFVMLTGNKLGAGFGDADYDLVAELLRLALFGAVVRREALRWHFRPAAEVVNAAAEAVRNL